MSPFDSENVPNISLYNYLERINKYAKCSDACFVIAYIYIRRVLDITSFILSKQNMYRVTLAAILTAIKFTDDLYANNKSYAVIGGVEVDEINKMESCMLALLEFSLFVDQELYFKTLTELSSHVEKEKDKNLKSLRLIGTIETLASNNEE